MYELGAVDGKSELCPIPELSFNFKPQSSR